MANIDNIDGFVRDVQKGLYAEHELIMFIMRHLIHPAQASWLHEQGLEIVDLLNGRFNSGQIPTIEAIFTDWNMKCRCVLFRLE